MTGPRALAAAAVLGWLLALPAVGYRAAAERAERRVELAVDYEALARRAGGQPEDLVRLLRLFAQRGATAAVVRERTLLSWQELGALTVVDGTVAVRVLEALRPALPPRGDPGLPLRPDWTYVSGTDPALGALLRRAWEELHAQGWLPEPPRALGFPPRVGRPWLLAIPLPYAHAKLMPLGYPPEAPDVLRRAGLRPVAVLRDAPPLPGLRHRLRLEALEQSGLRPPLVLLDANWAPGYPDRSAEVGRALAARGAQVALLEDWDQLGYVTRGGARELVEATGKLPVRAFAVQPELRGSLSPAHQQEQMLAAAAERRARMLFLHLLPDRPVEATLDLTAAVAEGLRKAGLAPGPAAAAMARPPAPYTLAGVLLAAAAAAAWAVYLAAERLNLPLAWTRLAALAPAAALAAAFPVGGETLIRQAAALVAACAFPWLALAAAEAAAHRLRPLPALVRGWAVAAAGVAVATAGGLLVAAALSSPEFLAVWAYFRGVKVSLAVPLLSVASVVLVEAVRAGRVRGPAWVLGLAAALLLAAVVVVRSAAAEQIPAAEAQARRLLSLLIGVRPRFKEFLVGVPALVLLGALRPPRGTWPHLLLSLASAVGLISVVNSFAHVFTPVEVSLRRTAWGLALGAAGGAALAWLLPRAAVAWSRLGAAWNGRRAASGRVRA